MSYTYWGIVISLGALILMLVVCIRMLSSNRNEARQESGQGVSGSVDMSAEPPIIHKRAA
jgi:hypothetical protein